VSRGSSEPSRGPTRAAIDSPLAVLLLLPEAPSAGSKRRKADTLRELWGGGHGERDQRIGHAEFWRGRPALLLCSG